MGIKDKLEIILITYNRKTYLKNTLQELLQVSCPVHDFNITVLDNHSQDGTDELIREIQTFHSNIKYVRNKYNLGISGNIARAMELAESEYLWILCDDDKYFWGNWKELELAILEEKPVICVSNYAISSSHKDDPAYWLYQMTFVPSIIINTKLFTDESIRNAFDNTFTLFSHLTPIVQFLNDGGEVKVLEHPIVEAGNLATDMSYIRGAKPSKIFHRSRTMYFPVGYANIVNNLSNRKLATHCFLTQIHGEHLHKCSYTRFLFNMFVFLNGNENRMHVADIYMVAPFWMRFIILLLHFLQNTWVYTLLKKSHINQLIS